MPVGFENSALKMSFSLSSLQSGGGQGSPQQVMMQVERPYNSLTKKSRVNLEREMWRRSWGTQEEKKDDFWAAIQPNYNYLMDNNLIESCKEAHGELSCDEEETALLSKWSFKDFTAQFSELCSWLNDIREAVYGKEENIRDRNLRLEHVEGMQRNVYKRKLFTEQAKRLLLEHSELQDEVTWRVNYLNSKWDMLEQSISPSKVDPSQKSFCADVEHEADCLKEWIREMERRLKPLNMHIVNDWTNQELVEKITECEVLHQDIRAHGKVVAAVLKRAELAEATASVQLARRLERRWHLLFLRALEWQFHLENLLKLRKHPLPEHLYSESDEEPLSKHPRLSSGDCSDHLTDDGSYFEDDIKDFWMKDSGSNSLPTPARSSAVLRRCSSVCGQSKDVGVNITPDSLVPQMPVKKCSKKKTVESKNSEMVVPLSERSHCSREMQNTGISPMESDATSFNKSDRKAHNCATFYFEHRDTDTEQKQFKENIEEEIATLNNKICEVKVCEDSSDEEWTYTSGKRTTVAKEKGNFLASGIQSLPSRKRNVAVRLDFGEKSSGSEGAGNSTQCHNFDDSIKCSGVADSSCKEALSLPRTTEETKECIQWLVRQAEILVREDSLMCSEDAQGPPVHGSEMTVSQLRHARIKQWVKMHSSIQDKFQLPDSCDASGEYTTGDSDEACSVDSREESSGISLVNKHLDALLNAHPRLDSAEGFSDPNVTLKADNSPDSADPKDSSKVIIRSNPRCKRERPWSVSGISQVSSLPGRDEEPGFANFSTSESALHQMMGSNNTIQDRENSVVSSNGFQDNLSSSTIYENTKVNSEHGSGSLQRRRARQRKKTPQSLCSKNATASDTAHVLSSGSISSTKFKNVAKSTLKVPSDRMNAEDFHGTPTEEKARTLSETTCTSATSEQNTVSDSSVFPTESSSSKILDAGDRTLISEEEFFSRKCVGLPVFRLGPKEGAVTPKPDMISHSLLPSGVDSDVEKTSGPQGAEEQLSSSEQAWDNYQVQLLASRRLRVWRWSPYLSDPVEKYMSEPYSEEIADSEFARRLLEFGDDYHNFLDSQSDCASSLGISQRTSPQRKRKSIIGACDSSVLDSDSDLEDIHHLIEQSQSHFVFTEQVLNRHLSKSSPDMWVTDYAEIIATCKENKRCLKVILENVKEGGILTLKERKEIKDLLEKWNGLQVYADELQRVSNLQQKVLMMRTKLLDSTTKISSLADNLNDMTHLESAIQTLKEESKSLLDFKDQLLHVNVAVHQLGTDSGSQDTTISSAVPQLKDEVTDLYRIWSSSFQSVSSRLAQFERAVQTWEKFDKELSELKTTLQGDHSTLVCLCKSLDDGATAVEDVAVSIRDIARLLSEVPGSSDRNHSSLCQDLQEACIGTREGSLSDSGISDSGSENELSERARRLTSLRQLAQHLQTELGASDGLVTQINEQIEHLDRELQQLQDVCRKLIVRTTSWSGLPPPEAIPAIEAKVSGNVQSNKQTSPSTIEANGKNIDVRSKPYQWRSGTSSSELRNIRKNGKTSKEQKRQPWVWRVARAAFPVQLTLVTLICLACFFEPHCCESVNNLSLSLSPQLRYVYGPPPV
ncbi:hypothetical protein R5R35_008546 [Gryllus longicercus]|uniref:KASH domain-containing protein n=1 Tax=Gryllus longicercus TaxID=2509291 RepID=A0AAN9VXN5_9ORTH